MKFKLRTAFALAALTALALPAAASAHIEAEPGEAPAGKATKINFVIPHGCDGAPTTSLTVQVPDSVSDATAKPVKGWNASNTPGQMKWSGGPLPDHQVQELPFTATLSGKRGDRVVFKLIQGCQGGKSIPWLQVVPEGAPEPETPAPVVTLTSSASAPSKPATEPAEGAGADQPSGTNGEQAATSDVPASAEEDKGLADGLIIAVFALVAVGILAGVLYWVRQSSKN